METRNVDDMVIKTQGWMQCPSHFLISPHSPGGEGLALFWKQEVEVEIISSCHNFIDTRIKAAGKHFFATFVYREPDRVKRKLVWNLLTAQGTNREDPWFLTGDFNDIIDATKKQGGPERHEGTFVDIRSFMAECDLYDLRHSRNFLSWRGKRYEHVVHCRLDRAMSNGAWAEAYPASTCVYLCFEGSDHRPLLTDFDMSKKKKKGIFRYDRRLKESEEVSHLIEEAWNYDNQEDVEEKINRCRRDIIIWTREKHQNSQKLIKEYKQKLEEAMTSQEPNLQLISSINNNLLLAYKAEEAFWKQRSRQIWLALGDKN